MNSLSQAPCPTPQDRVETQAEPASPCLPLQMAANDSFSVTYPGNPQPGDLIEIFRPAYQHWALYLGDGYVINVAPVGKRCPTPPLPRRKHVLPADVAMPPGLAGALHAEGRAAEGSWHRCWMLCGLWHVP